MQYENVHVMIYTFIHMFIYGQVIFYFDTVAAAGNIHDCVFTFVYIQ